VEGTNWLGKKSEWKAGHQERFTIDKTVFKQLTELPKVDSNASKTVNEYDQLRYIRRF